MLATTRPDNAVVLFDGTSLDGWAHTDGRPVEWKLVDGAIEVVPRSGSIVSEYLHGDCLLHLEFKLSHMPEVTGQKKANSGVFLQDRYEIQVLDSSGWDIPGTGDCGAVYNHHAPLANACKPALEWQTFDILFRAPRFGTGRRKIENCRITVIHNGIVIHNNIEQVRGTRGNPPPPDDWDAGPGPIQLQDHGNVVWFRNIWLLPLSEEGSRTYRPSMA